VISYKVAYQSAAFQNLACRGTHLISRENGVFFLWIDSPRGPRPPHCRGFEITLRHAKLGGYPLDEWSARRRKLYLTPHSTLKRRTSMPPAGFETPVPAGQRPLGSARTEITLSNYWYSYKAVF
jgi:hypothetical protein